MSKVRSKTVISDRVVYTAWVRTPISEDVLHRVADAMAKQGAVIGGISPVAGRVTGEVDGWPAGYLRIKAVPGVGCMMRLVKTKNGWAWR